LGLRIEMATPSNFKALAALLRPRKVLLWYIAAAGLGVILLSFLLVALRITHSVGIPVSLGTLALTGAWGLILVESWFSETARGPFASSVAARFPRTYASAHLVAAWYGSSFLVLWFIVGCAMSATILVKL
jgi:hypothetical protein